MRYKDKTSKSSNLESELISKENNKRKITAIKKYVDDLSEEELKELLFNYIISDDNFHIEYSRLDSLPTLKLSTVVEAFDMIDENWNILVNIKTNECYSYSDFISDKEEEEKYYEMIEDDNVISLPQKFELKEYNTMKEFVLSIKILNSEIDYYLQ